LFTNLNLNELKLHNIKFSFLVTLVIFHIIHDCL
jgi:hypothetical protein